jgi:hypothetical protein
MQSSAVFFLPAFRLPFSPPLACHQSINTPLKIVNKQPINRLMLLVEQMLHT